MESAVKDARSDWLGSGFNNRNTFTTAFKKETGKNPHEYLGAIRKSNQ